jgi:hypothetical protein
MQYGRSHCGLTGIGADVGMILASAGFGSRGLPAMPLVLCGECEIYFTSDEAEGPAAPACPRCGARTRPVAAVAAEELESVTLALSDALAYAQAGKHALGYALLIRGLLRAERLLTEGNPWAPQLLRAWRAAIDRYSERAGDQEEAEADLDAGDREFGRSLRW